LLQLGDSRRAKRMFTRSLELYPTDVWALNNRGIAYMKLGNERKARGDFAKAIQLDPGFEQVKKNLSDASQPPR
jgi:Flp pilus assembly protein TadD